MSTGAYFIDIPEELIGGAVLAVGALGIGAVVAVGALGAVAGAAMSAGGEALLGAAGKTWEIVERERLRQLELAEQSGRLKEEVMRAHEAADAVLSDIALFQESLKTLNFQYRAETMTFVAREEGVGTGMSSTLNLDDLMFVDVDVQTREISYVVLDFSEAISMQSAKNSAQFKKMSLASDLMKKVMVWVVDDPQDQAKLNQLIQVVNEMLDNNEVSFSHFQQFVQLRFAEFQKQQASIQVDRELWDRYCALCAMQGQRPKRLSGEALVEEMRRLMKKSATDKFVSAARQAFQETVREMGMEIRSDHMLDQVPGMLLVDKENPGYNMFVSEHDVSFMLEMVETGEAAPEDRPKQRANVCKKRREIEKRMLEKGYRLKLCIADDEANVSVAAVEEKKDNRQSNAEQMRRRRMMAGKKAKLKMAGGR